MYELQSFVHEDFGQIRVLEQDGEPWFVAVDVCRALELGNPTQSLTRLDDDEKSNTLISNEGIRGNPNVAIINEPGLYTLVLGSRKPEAKAFKRWITHEVLPAIRRTGNYSLNTAQAETPQRTITTDDYLKAASIVANCRNERLPYVLGFLEQGGLSIPKIHEINRRSLTDGRHARYAKTGEDVSIQEAARSIIQEAIKSYGFSCAQVSRLTGIPQSCINRYCRASNRPTPERARYIVEILMKHIPVEEEGKQDGT